MPIKKPQSKELKDLVKSTLKASLRFLRLKINASIDYVVNYACAFDERRLGVIH